MEQQNKEHQKKLLTEIMEEDQKNGLYDHIGDTNKKVTAVEWLQNRLPSLFEHDYNGFYKKIFEEAKQMEKEQITNAYEHGQNNGYMYRDGGSDIINEEQYYKETYKSND